MGFLSAYSGTRKIDVGGGYWVEVKECLSAAEKQRAEDALSKQSVNFQGQVGATIDMTSFHNVMMAAAIVGWNLDEDDGTPWALVPESAKRANIARLPAPVYDQIWTVVDDSNGPRERTDAVRFPDDGLGGDPDGDGGTGVAVDVHPAAAAVAAGGDAPGGSGGAALA